MCSRGFRRTLGWLFLWTLGLFFYTKIFFNPIVIQCVCLDCSSLLNNMLHRSCFWGVQIDLVFGQNLENGPKLQPPLCLRYTMSGQKQKQVGFTQWMTMCTMHWNNGKMKQGSLTQSQCPLWDQRVAGRSWLSSSFPEHRQSLVC